MKIKTIDQQICEIFKAKLHEYAKKSFYIYIQDIKCSVMVLKKEVFIKTEIRREFGSLNLISVELQYNTDIKNKVKKFLNSLTELKNLQNIAANLIVPDRESIEIDLSKQLATDYVKVSYWHEDLFDDKEITFWLHPYGSAPAEGVLMCIEKDTHKLNPYWNDSLKHRKILYFYDKSREQIEHIFGKKPLKEKVAALEVLEGRIAAFDVNKSPKLLDLIKFNKEVDSLMTKYRELVSNNLS